MAAIAGLKNVKLGFTGEMIAKQVHPRPTASLPEPTSPGREQSPDPLEKKADARPQTLNPEPAAGNGVDEPGR